MRLRLLGGLECHLMGEGPPLVMIHGIQGTAEAWRPVARLVAAHRRCVMPNLPGRGESPRWTPARGPVDAYYHLDRFASELRGLLDCIGEPTTLAGWSMGVSVILRMLELHGAAGVSGLALASGTACATPGAQWFRGDNPEAVAREAKARAARLGLTAVADADAVAHAWFSVRDADLRAALGRIVVPTLVLHGDDDDQCPLAHGCALAQAIPGARLRVLAGVGHNPLAACPAEVAGELLAL